jgi:hypothetical protein
MSQKIGITLTDDILQAVKAEADADGKSEAQVIREALKEHFQRKGIKVNARFKTWGGKREAAGRKKKQISE